MLLTTITLFYFHLKFSEFFIILFKAPFLVFSRKTNIFPQDSPQGFKFPFKAKRRMEMLEIKPSTYGMNADFFFGNLFLEILSWKCQKNTQNVLYGHTVIFICFVK